MDSSPLAIIISGYLCTKILSIFYSRRNYNYNAYIRGIIESTGTFEKEAIIVCRLAKGPVRVDAKLRLSSVNNDKKNKITHVELFSMRLIKQLLTAIVPITAESD